MKPAAFEYVRPTTVTEAVTLLAADGEAKVIAGGQSLLPLMNLRLATPSMLVDIARLRELDVVRVTDDRIELGAMTRHSRVELDPDIRAAQPLLAEAAGHIGHRAIRNHGTIGGTLAHADAAAEMPAALTAVGGHVEVVSPRGRRTIAADDLWLGSFSTTIEPDELLVTVVAPRFAPGTSWGFCELGARPADFAQAGAAVVVTPTAGAWSVRIAVFAATTAPALLTFELDPGAPAGAGDAAISAAVADLRSRLLDDRAELAVVACRRALSDAVQRLGHAVRPGAGR